VIGAGNTVGSTVLDVAKYPYEPPPYRFDLVASSRMRMIFCLERAATPGPRLWGFTEACGRLHPATFRAVLLWMATVECNPQP
jgi:hypothetical protein